MKTKLLRKIRKRYSIVYYPNGFESHGKLWCTGKYDVSDNGGNFSLEYYPSKQKAIDAIMKRVRVKYAKYSVNNKNNLKGIKVWYNGE